MANPLSVEAWKAVALKLIEAAPWDDQSIYLQVTRGADDKRDHAFPPASVPHRLLSPSPRRWSPRRPRSVPRASPPSPYPTCAGRAATCEVISLLRQCAGPPTGCRTGLRRGAADPRRFHEGRRCLQHLHRQGRRADRPAQDPPDAAWHHLRRDPRTGRAAHSSRWSSAKSARRNFVAADEVWMTSSTKEILAIATLDGQPVGTGKPGPLRRTDVAVVPGFQEHRNAQRLTWLPTTGHPSRIPLRLPAQDHGQGARRTRPGGAHHRHPPRPRFRRRNDGNARQFRRQLL